MADKYMMADRYKWFGDSQVPKKYCKGCGRKWGTDETGELPANCSFCGWGAMSEVEEVGFVDMSKADVSVGCIHCNTLLSKGIHIGVKLNRDRVVFIHRECLFKWVRENSKW